MSTPDPDNIEQFPAAKASNAEQPAAAELTECQRATMGWAGLQLQIWELQAAVRELMSAAQAHPPTAGKRNARVLVYEDRLAVLVDLAAKPVPSLEEAVQHWQSRADENAELAELRRMAHRLIGIVRRLEATAGVDSAERTEPDLVKMEGMTGALIQIVEKQAQEIAQLRNRIMGGAN